MNKFDSLLKKMRKFAEYAENLQKKAQEGYTGTAVSLMQRLYEELKKAQRVVDMSSASEKNHKLVTQFKLVMSSVEADVQDAVSARFSRDVSLLKMAVSTLEQIVAVPMASTTAKSVDDNLKSVLQSAKSLLAQLEAKEVEWRQFGPERVSGSGKETGRDFTPSKTVDLTPSVTQKPKYKLQPGSEKTPRL